MKFYAKSKPDILTVAEHTDDVVQGVEVFARHMANASFS